MPEMLPLLKGTLDLLILKAGGDLPAQEEG